jgi:hypothetical protein
MLALAELNAYTTDDIVPKATDVIFKKSPLLVRMLSRNTVNFDGGMHILRPLVYAELFGGFFSKGDTLNISYAQTDTAFSVTPKYAYCSIFLPGTDDVLNRGRHAAFSQVELKFANASAKMAKILATGIYQDGQTASGTGVLSPSSSIDGLLAWIDDGNSSGSYTTSANSDKSFLAVGGITRNDLFVTPPVFTGATTPNAAGVQGANSYVNRAWSSFSLQDIQTAFGFAWFGNDFPDLIVTTQSGFNKIWNATQPNQRYMDSTGDMADVGFKSFRFNGVAEVVVDKYIPSDGTNGVMFLLNTRYIEFYITTNKKFQFGFTGFKDAQNTIDLAGQYLWAGNVICANPRTSAKLVGTSIL